MKLNITLNDDLVARLDAYASENYMSRSGLISIAAVQYLNQVEMITAVKGVAQSIRKIADSGEFDEETLRKFEEFELMARMIAMQ